MCCDYQSAYGQTAHLYVHSESGFLFLIGSFIVDARIETNLLFESMVAFFVLTFSSPYLSHSNTIWFGREALAHASSWLYVYEYFWYFYAATTTVVVIACVRVFDNFVLKRFLMVFERHSNGSSCCVLMSVYSTHRLIKIDVVNNHEPFYWICTKMQTTLYAKKKEVNSDVILQTKHSI